MKVINEIEHIKTETSSLKTYDIEDKDLINKCVEDIKNELINKPPVIIYGKLLNQNRDIGFYSNEIEEFKYSGTSIKSKKLSKNLKKLIKNINKLFNTNYNGILINRYNDGNDKIGAHKDKEKCLDLNDGVLSISFGESRKFRIKDNNKKTIKDIILYNKSLCLMSGNFQNEFYHEIPQEKNKGCRYSFTFRKFII